MAYMTNPFREGQLRAYTSDCVIWLFPKQGSVVSCSADFSLRSLVETVSEDLKHSQ